MSCPDYVPDDLLTPSPWAGMPREGFIGVECPACLGIVTMPTGPDFWDSAGNGVIRNKYGVHCMCLTVTFEVTLEMMRDL